MSKTKIVNIDDLAQASKAIVIDGQTHEMREMTVQEFIDKAKAAREVEKAAQNESVDEQMRQIVTMVHDAFPTVSEERLARLKLPQLMAIMDLIVKTPEQIEADVKAELASGNG